MAAFTQAYQFWNQGNQDAALNLLRPRAKDGQPWAAALLAWLLMQQGSAGIDESITWAVRAAELGIPSQAFHTFNNAVANLVAVPQLMDRLPELFPWAASWHGGIDVVGQGWNLLAQGNAELGLQFMSVFPTAWYPEPIAQATSRLQELNALVTAARTAQADVVSAAAEAHHGIQQARDDLETNAKQANLLVSSVRSGAVAEHFVKDAERNSKESRSAWIVGLVVLGAAAFVAVLPVVLNYLDVGPDYSSIEAVGIHLVSTAALASFAGVLLARARSRDQAAQRARDLSTAMGTMISYSGEITDPDEKQRFMTLMGQMILQAHLTAGSKSSGNDDSATQLLNAAGLIRTLSNSPSTPQS